jgi:hypothetical protein
LFERKGKTPVAHLVVDAVLQVKLCGKVAIYTETGRRSCDEMLRWKDATIMVGPAGYPGFDILVCMKVVSSDNGGQQWFMYEEVKVSVHVKYGSHFRNHVESNINS